MFFLLFLIFYNAVFLKRRKNNIVLRKTKLWRVDNNDKMVTKLRSKLSRFILSDREEKGTGDGRSCPVLFPSWFGFIFSFSRLFLFYKKVFISSFIFFPPKRKNKYTFNSFINFHPEIGGKKHRQMLSRVLNFSIF